MNDGRRRDSGAGEGGERGWGEVDYHPPLQSPSATRRIWDGLEPVPERPGAEGRFLAAAAAGRERRLLREAAGALPYGSSESLGAHLARARAAAGITIERVAEYVGIAASHLDSLEVSDSALNRFGPAQLAALVDLLELPFAVAAQWIRTGLGPWLATGGLRSAAAPIQEPPALTQHLSATAAELRRRGRGDLLDALGAGDG